MRWLFAAVALLLTGCGPGLQFNIAPITADQMLDRATLAFVGTIERQTLINWPFLRIPGQDTKYWRVMDRRVRVETILKGQESRKLIDIYEFRWIGGTTGDWNLTYNHGRYLFLVQREGDRYHVVRDWWRSIYPIRSGKHDRFPLDNSSPAWERVALLQYWVHPGWIPEFLSENHLDPGRALGAWRRVKILRGFLRYPDPRLREEACSQLTAMEQGQDQCSAFYKWAPDGWIQNRRWENERARDSWGWWLSQKDKPGAMDQLKLLTTVNNPTLREEFCRRFQHEFPNDHDNGCPANQPPPATIVTADGDLPLLGPWPSER